MSWLDGLGAYFSILFVAGVLIWLGYWGGKKDAAMECAAERERQQRIDAAVYNVALAALAYLGCRTPPFETSAEDTRWYRLDEAFRTLAAHKGIEWRTHVSMAEFLAKTAGKMPFPPDVRD